MDIKRGEEVKKAKQRKRIIVVALLVVGVAATTYALSQLKPAAPTVDNATVWPDTVKRGEMLRQVRGLGTLVPEDIRWIPATTDGRVDKIILRPGALVKADSVILELTNPQLEQEAVDAGLQLKVAEADLENLRVQLESQLLTIKSDVARSQADFTQNKLQAAADEALWKDELVSRHVRDLSANRAAESTTRYELEKQRLANFADSMKAQLAARQAQVEQRQAFFELKKTQLDKLRVRSGLSGVLQALPVEVGQQVAPGTNLCRVSNPTRLKAEVRIAETQARDIAIGQVASVDTRNGIIPGRVSRIDPAAVQGTVLVDITLEGPLPAGARPDLSVDGTIEIERLTNVLYVGRPVQGQPNSTIGLFKIEEDGVHASRTQVKLGRSSVNTIEIVEGLSEGDRVILSDMSQFDNVDRIRLN
ncbi:MAG: efflux RND transporter periplasmic adaptor subunit [Candidatus Acidiferrales bacterium]